MNNDLRNAQDTNPDTVPAFAPVSSTVASPHSDRLTQPRNARTGQYEGTSEPYVRQRVDTVLAELQAARGVPVALVEALRLELATVLVAAEQLADRLNGQLLSQRGVLRGPARTRQRLLERATTIANLLGYERESSSGSGKRPWSKLSRAEQELEAQRAFDEVERNFTSREDDDAND